MKHFNQIAFLLSLVINCLSHATPPDATQPDFHQAVVAGNFEQVQQVLLYVGLDVNAADRRGNTPLHLAVENKNKAIVRLLLYSYANVNAVDDYGQTPLHAAAMNGNKPIVLLLLDANADVNASDNDGNTPLHVALWKDHEVIVDLLIKRGAKVDTANKFGETPLHLAAESNHKGVIKLLLDNGEKVNTVNKQSNRTGTVILLKVEKNLREGQQNKPPEVLPKRKVLILQNIKINYTASIKT